MRSSSNAVRYLGAAGILALGGVCAASIFSRSPRTPGPDPQQLAMLAARVEPLDQFPPPNLAAPSPRPRWAQPARAPRVTREVSVKVSSPPKATAPEPTLPPIVPPESPAKAGVKQIALMGVTQQGDEITAWLVDLATQAREVAEAGDSAFGFDVKEVSAESVVLTQGDEEFTVRLGEKEIPVAEPPAAAAPVQSASTFGGGRGNAGWRGNFRSSTGRSRSFSDNSNRNRSSNRGNDGNRRSNSGNRGFVGGFPRAISGGFSGRGNRNNQGFLQPSANPQEARRRGVRFIGDGDPLPQPTQIQNPQTQRRRGSVSGPAFGQANGNSRASSGNRTGGNNRR